MGNKSKYAEKKKICMKEKTERKNNIKVNNNYKWRVAG